MKMRICCTTCPNECELDVEIDENKKILSATGNKCPRGLAFAEKEVVDPVRVLASTVKVDNGAHNALLPVRTKEAIPLRYHFEVMHQLEQMEVSAPIQMGDVILPNVCDTGVDVIASRNIR
ncbi:MAG: DUF1667 domain-containing protein [Solobacterium sp.]|nr:DUF1667 domain-containing protein [Solobacterium sp.]